MERVLKPGMIVHDATGVLVVTPKIAADMHNQWLFKHGACKVVGKVKKRRKRNA